MTDDVEVARLRRILSRIGRTVTEEDDWAPEDLPDLCANLASEVDQLREQRAAALTELAEDPPASFLGSEHTAAFYAAQSDRARVILEGPES